MNDIVIPNLKMAEMHAKMIREELDNMDPKDPSVMMLKTFADDVVAEIGLAIDNLEE